MPTRLPHWIAHAMAWWNKFNNPFPPEPAASPASPAPTATAPASSMAQLDAAKVTAARMALENWLQQTRREQTTHQAQMESLRDAYAIAEGDEMRRRTVAQQYQFAEKLQAVLEERHADLLRLAEFWAHVDLQQKKQLWQQETMQQPNGAPLDVAAIKDMMAQAIAQGELLGRQMEQVIDMADTAAEKSRLRRSANLQMTMQQLDALVEAHRNQQAERLAPGLERIAQTLEEQSQQRQSATAPVPQALPQAVHPAAHQSTQQGIQQAAMLPQRQPLPVAAHGNLPDLAPAMPAFARTTSGSNKPAAPAPDMPDDTPDDMHTLVGTPPRAPQ